MPRAGWRKPESESRLSDHISIGVLTRTYPPRVVDAAVAGAGRQEQRHRLLPARVVVYYVMALALFSHAAYEEVMRSLVEGLAWSKRWRTTTWSVPTKAAIYKARVRLGAEPLRRLFHSVVRPLGTPQSRGVWYRTWRLMSIDGTVLDVADTPANEKAFGRPGHSRGEGSAFPQVRLAALAESGTHAVVDVALGPCTVGELTLASQLFRSLQPGMLCLADRLYFSYHLWREASANGADLLWRTRTNSVLPVDEELSDGSYLSQLFATPKDRTAARDGIPVRVIEYVLDGVEQAAATTYRLITTILDPALAPADELAAAYAERWEFETALDELKTHQRGPRLILRSKHPDGVEQEIYGYLLTHYAIRVLMHEAALEAEEDPDRLSFIRSLRVVRRTQASGLFSPSRDRRGASSRGRRDPLGTPA